MSFIFEFVGHLIEQRMEDPVKRREARAAHLKAVQADCAVLCVPWLRHGRAPPPRGGGRRWGEVAACSPQPCARGAVVNLTSWSVRWTHAPPLKDTFVLQHQELGHAPSPPHLRGRPGEGGQRCATAPLARQICARRSCSATRPRLSALLSARAALLHLHSTPFPSPPSSPAAPGPPRENPSASALRDATLTLHAPSPLTGRRSGPRPCARRTSGAQTRTTHRCAPPRRPARPSLSSAAALAHSSRPQLAYNLNPMLLKMSGRREQYPNPQ